VTRVGRRRGAGFGTGIEKENGSGEPGFGGPASSGGSTGVGLTDAA